ncbi:MAG: epimerase, partial [Bdellovibrionota bacterium]
LAYEKGKTGERYILSGENRTIKGWLDLFSKVTGMPTVKLWSPNFAALIGAYFLEAISNWITKKPPLLTTANIRASRFYLYYDNSKARKELSWEPTPLEGHVRESALWFLENGYIKKKRAERLRKNLG